MTEFIVKYHIYVDDIKTNKSLIVSFKWYEYITHDRIIKRFFKNLKEDYPVYYSDIDSVILIL